MLIRFTVENFLSFAAPATLDLRVSAAARPRGVPLPDGSAVARCALLYGPAGAGKSNLLKALVWLRNLVLGGARPGRPLPLSPYKLGAGAAPLTRLELEVLHEGAQWRYGFALSTAAVEEEWLFVQEPGGAPRRVFERRRLNPPLSAVDVQLGEALHDERGRLQLLAYGTRQEQLLLSEGVQRGAATFAPLGEWLNHGLQLLRPEAKIVGLAARLAQEPRFAAFLARWLDEMGTGFSEATVARAALPDDYFESDEERHEVLSALARHPDSFAETPEGELIASDERGVEQVRLLLRARAADGRLVDFAPAELSEGTMRLLHLAPAFLLYESGGPVVLADELDRSLSLPTLHRLLERSLGAAAGQLIATTHDAALLDAGLLDAEHVHCLEHVAPRGSRCSRFAALPPDLAGLELSARLARAGGLQH